MAANLAHLNESVAALDGYPIAARRFPLDGPRARIVVASATGVPQGFYTAFATHAQARGFDVVTFDYRGIGDSAPASLRGFDVDYRDWARLDLAGVLEHFASDLPIHLVAHSFGGLALGLVPDPSVVSTMHAFGIASGWHGWMPRAEQIRVTFLWNVVGPVVVGSRGYLAWKRLGFGEDLPLGVYRQWKRWCRFPGYWFDDPDIGAQMDELFARVQVPITAVNAIDDRWASPAARDAIFDHYVNSPVTKRELHPGEIGQSSIGHMGYFRRGSEPLWNTTLDDLSRA